MTCASPTPVSITLEPVSRANLEQVEALTVSAEQSRFVAAPSYYLTVCFYGGKGFRPLAVCTDGVPIGFAMWRIEDGRGWICGFLIDRAWQGKGLGRTTFEALVSFLAAKGCREIALSYDPQNLVAQRLYHSSGFVDSGEQLAGETLALLACTQGRARLSQ